MKFSIFQESRKGGRRANQDRIGYAYTRDSLLAVVADGMGGHLHGEVAAQITVQYLTEAFQRDAKGRLADPRDFLTKGILEAHYTLADYARARGLGESPRTTCVACVVQDSVAYCAHVGDSRLYHVRRGQVQVQTRDHSRVQVLIDRGRIREEAVAAHPDRNKIFNCIGAVTPPEVDLSGRMALQEGDILLLCSDGLWGPLTRKLITGALLRGDVMKAAPELLDLAEARAGKDADNLSVVAIAWEEKSADATTVPGPDLDGVTTQREDFNKAEGSDLTEEEIEIAIAEIRAAIHKHLQPKP